MEYAHGLVLGLIGGLVGWTCASVSQIGSRTRRLEAKITLLLEHSEVDLTEVATRKASELIQEDKNLGAVRAFGIYQDLTGATRSEAKEAIERLQKNT